MTAATAKLPPTSDPRCGSSAGYLAHWRRGESACPACTASERIRAHARITTPAGRKSNRQSAMRSRQILRARSEDRADADFERIRGAAKPCAGCGELLPAEAFGRHWVAADGRASWCSQNGCYNRHQRLKRWAQHVPLWIARGLDPDHCSYCLRPIGLGDRDVDHFHSVARGGSDDLSNLVPSCPDCNRGQGGKFDRDPFEWLTATHPTRLEFFRALFPTE